MELLDKMPRLALDIFVRRAKATVLLSQMSQLQTRLFLHPLIRTVGEFAVGDRRKIQDYVADINITTERRIGIPFPRLGVMRLEVFVVLFFNRVTGRLVFRPFFRTSGPQDTNCL